MADSSIMAHPQGQHGRDRTAVYDDDDDAYYYSSSYAYHEYDYDYYNYNYYYYYYPQHDPQQKHQQDDGQYQPVQRPHDQRPQRSLSPSPPATCPSSPSRPSSDPSSRPSDSRSRSSASSGSPRTSVPEYVIHLPPIAKSPPWPRTTCTGGGDGFGLVRGPVMESGAMAAPAPTRVSADPTGQGQTPTFAQSHTHTQSGQHAEAEADWGRIKEPPGSSSRASACVASSLEDVNDGVDEEEYEYCEAREERIEDRENAFVILLRLSFLTPPFSFGAAIYTFFVLLVFIFTLPLRLFNPPFSLPHLQRILLPVLRHHQRLICPSSAAAQRRRERDPYHTAASATTTTATTSTSPPSSPRDTVPPSSASPSSRPSSSASHSALLVLVHLVSPLLILPLVFASWTAACFWVFAMVLGDPGGGTGPRRNDDGRAAVLAVRNWWRAWLGKADKSLITHSNNTNDGRRTKRGRRKARRRADRDRDRDRDRERERPEMREQAQ